MDQTFDIVTLGNGLIDAFLTIHDANIHCHINEKECELCVKYGEKISLDGCSFQLGGNACNVAVGMRRLGFTSALIAEIGEDSFSQTIINGLTQEQVSTTHLKQSPGESSFAIGLQFQGDRTLFVNHVSRDHKFDFTNIATKWIYITSLGSEWKLAYQSAQDFVKQYNVQVAFNPGTPQFDAGVESFQELFLLTKVLFVNKQEAQVIAKNIKPAVKGKKLGAGDLLPILQNAGPEIVVITDGANGAWAIDQNHKVYFQKALVGKVVEKTGAGDAYATGFLAAHMAGYSMERAMEWGAVNALSVIGQVGSQPGLLNQESMIDNLSQAYPQKEQRMDIYLGTDHRGFQLSQALTSWLQQNNIPLHLLGDMTLDPTDDYVDYAVDVSRQVASRRFEARGIVLCGSGTGVSIAANKIPGIRCVLGFSEAQVKASRNDDDVNVLAIPADYVDLVTAKRIIKVFLETNFSGEEKHVRRIEKITQLEK